MNVEISVKQIVEIPDDKLDKVVKDLRKQFELAESSPINLGDIVRTAIRLGIIESPESEWDAADPDEEIDQSELIALFEATQ